MLTGLQLRIAAGLLVLAAAFGAGWRWEHGRAERRAAVVAAAQAQRDAVAAAAYQKAVSERDTAEQEARDANRRIFTDLEPKLAAAAADGARLARLLHEALARASSGPAEAPSGVPGAADSPGVPGSQSTVAGPIERATGEALAACQRDSARLAALQEEVRGQMP